MPRVAVGQAAGWYRRKPDWASMRGTDADGFPSVDTGPAQPEPAWRLDVRRATLGERRDRVPERCFSRTRGLEGSMDVDRMRRVETVLDAVLTREPTQWPALLDEACSGDPELRKEVEALLARLDTASRFLDSPPGAIA